MIKYNIKRKTISRRTVDFNKIYNRARNNIYEITYKKKVFLWKFRRIHIEMKGIFRSVILREEICIPIEGSSNPSLKYICR